MKIQHKDATIKATGSDEDFPGTFEVILSAPTEDRDGDTLTPDGWKMPLPEHITFDQDHGMTVATTVGSGKPRIEEETGNLIVAGTYSSLPRAQEVRTLVNEGHIQTTSVAFMTYKERKDGGKEVAVRELLNGAFVAIPSNREALVLSSKGAKEGRRNSTKDAEAIQSLHDTLLVLGATCETTPDAAKAIHGKALAGSLEAKRERVQDALYATYGKRFWYIRGVLDAAVVFDLLADEDEDTYEVDTYQQSYTDDGSTVTLTGDLSPVDIEEVVREDAPSGPNTPASEETDSPDESAATDDKSAAADQSDDKDLALRVRSLWLLAEGVDPTHKKEN